MQARKGIPRIHCFFITLSEYLDFLRRRRLAVVIDAADADRLACDSLQTYGRFGCICIDRNSTAQVRCNYGTVMGMGMITNLKFNVTK